MRDEPFCSFGARVSDKADTCALSTECLCSHKVVYSDNMIQDTLLNGIADTDIRPEVLRNTYENTTAINGAIFMVESKEIVCNATPSFPIINVTA